MKPPPPPKNENGTVPIPEVFSHGDHVVTPEAAVVFEDNQKYGSRSLQVRATVVIRCPACGWNARASKAKYEHPGNNPNANFSDADLRKVLEQALNNFKSKVPPSCEEALVKFVMSS